MKKLFKALAIRIFLSRVIGAEELGLYQIAFSIFMVFETFISSGLPLIVSKTTANLNSLNENNKKEGSLITSALIIGIITAITICFVVLIFKNLFFYIFTDKRCFNILLILLPSLVFSSVYSILRGNLWGHRKYFLVSITEFFEQLFRILFCIIFFTLFDFCFSKIQTASLSYVFSCLLSSLIVLMVYKKNNGTFYKPNKSAIKMLVKSSTPITFVRVISSLLTPLISIIIPMQLINCLGYSNSQALSIFGIFIHITNIQEECLTAKFQPLFRISGKAL